MKTVIIYYSKHHENTRKLLDAIKAAFPEEITLIDAASADAAGISASVLDRYDAVGFASGIYFSKFEKRVLDLAEKCLPDGKNVFFIYTCGAGKKGYTESIRKAIAGKKANILGEYGCKGFDTYGPFKLVGGIAKNHPDSEEVKGAVEFYKRLCH